MTPNRSAAVLLFVAGVVTMLAGGLGLVAVSLDSGGAEQPQTSVGDAVDSLHERGVTGDNVSVGVLDVTGFETDRPQLRDSVAAVEQFGDTGSAVTAAPDHGTKAARTVASVAPDAQLYLGTFEGPAAYASAMDWLLERDVDVVVAPVAYAGSLGDGSSQVARATTVATDRGVLVVAPSGNLAQGHWLGTYAPTGDGVHVFGDQTVNEISGPAGRAEFWLATDGAPGEYRLELYELREDRDPALVARSVPYEGGTVTSQRLTVRLDEGRYGLVVRGPAAETDATIRVASATHSLARGLQARSVAAPAAAPGALSVGAFDPVTNQTEPFSSRGPTRDGRLGVDVVAPSRLSLDGASFEGTSASASFVGGVAALVVDTAPDQSPAALQDLLTTTADPLNGVNAASGHGRVAPTAAVARAADDSPSETALDERHRARAVAQTSS